MTEDEAIAQAAEKYRADGYDVIVRPPAAELPPDLRDRRPGLIARRNGTSVLLEIWTRGRVNDLPPTWMPPGWQFDIVSLPRNPTETYIPGPPATAEFTARLLAELDEMMPRAASHGRLLLAWSAAEAALRVAAGREAIPAEDVPLEQLIGDLTSEGVVTSEQYDRLRDLRATRNRLAHGTPVGPVAAADVDFLAGLARDLLAAEPAKAAG